MDVYVEAILRLACKSSPFVAKHADFESTPIERVHARSTRQLHRRHHLDISDAALDHIIEMEMEKRTLVHTKPSTSEEYQSEEEEDVAEPEGNSDE